MTRGNNVFGTVRPQLAGRTITGSSINDLFLYSLFARIAMSNNDTVEFNTEYNAETNTVELNIPDEYMVVFDQVTGMQRGENFQTFINWLIGSESLTPASILDTDQDFIPASGLTSWTGAQSGQLDNKLVLYLPAELLSTVGYNTKLADDYDVTSLTLSAIWVYDSGSNTSFETNSIVTVTNIGTGSVVSVSNTESVSTVNLISGDIRETEILSSDVVISGGDLLSIVINRNADGHTDPQTDLVGLLGLKLTLS